MTGKSRRGQHPDDPDPAPLSRQLKAINKGPRLTQAMVDAMVQALIQGHTRDHAAWRAGLTPRAFQNYMRHGEDGIPEFQLFYNSVLAAEEKAIYEREKKFIELERQKIADAEFIREKAMEQMQILLGTTREDGTPKLSSMALIELLKYASNEMANTLGVGIPQSKLHTRPHDPNPINNPVFSIEDALRRRKAIQQQQQQEAAQSTALEGETIDGN